MYVSERSVSNGVVSGEWVYSERMCESVMSQLVNNELSESMMSPWSVVRELSVVSHSSVSSERMSMWMMSEWLDELVEREVASEICCELGKSELCSEWLVMTEVCELGMRESVSDVMIGERVSVGDSVRSEFMMSPCVSDFVSEVCMNWRKSNEKVLSESVSSELIVIGDSVKSAVHDEWSCVREWVSPLSVSERLLSECVSESMSEWWVSGGVSEVVVMSEVLVVSVWWVSEVWVSDEVKVLSELVSCVGCCVSEWIKNEWDREIEGPEIIYSCL
ncbi:hypothetical protein DPMN_153717 [Dreissena polymorpha]|uniref:Uncharacterized protein n=1 Tax=Dreissena polymorpha TaxID=45954 RepID=A0A9D4J9M9_DREPO|nr:hypothetical protein DPMN_153717 [Dreissena polymorpha]